MILPVTSTTSADLSIPVTFDPSPAWKIPAMRSSSIQRAVPGHLEGVGELGRTVTYSPPCSSAELTADIMPRPGLPHPATPGHRTLSPFSYKGMTMKLHNLRQRLRDRRSSPLAMILQNDGYDVGAWWTHGCDLVILMVRPLSTLRAQEACSEGHVLRVVGWLVGRDNSAVGRLGEFGPLHVDGGNDKFER